MSEISFGMPVDTELMTTAEVAQQLHTSAKVVLENARKCLPNKRIENGKPTLWTQAEITVLLDCMKNNSSNHASDLYFESKGSLSTDLTPALKIKKAFDLMQEGYREELEILKAKNLEQEKRLAIAEPKAKWYDDFCDSTGLIEIGVVGKHLEKYGLGAKKIFDRLKADGIIYEKSADGLKSYYAYFRYKQYFDYRNSKFEKGDGKTITYYKLMCTKAGAAWLESKYSSQRLICKPKADLSGTA